MAQTLTLQVNARGDCDIVMTREFDAPRRLVFEAWTTPDFVKRWLGVRAGWTLAVCEIDLRPGGAYRYVWRHEKRGREMGAGGVFREVDPPVRFVATETFDDPWYPGGAVSDTVFTEHDGRTTVTITMTYATREARDGVMASGFEQGITESYEMLSALLADTRNEGR